jgi:RNA polymerase subunit RPABC4/transcription elongation factor Spt4
MNAKPCMYCKRAVVDLEICSKCFGEIAQEYTDLLLQARPYYSRQLLELNPWWRV